MEVLYFLESIRMPVLNEFMLLVTRLGEETTFLVAALIVFWCVDKRKGYYLMAVGFIGTMANQFLKLSCRVPRPWVQDANFTILEEAREAATGYSFPSGHSQSAVGTFGAIANTTKTRWVRILCVVVCVLVPLSRMYVGVHTPSDVLVGSGMAILLVGVLKKPVLQGGDRTMKVLIVLMLAMAMGLLAYVELWKFPADMDAHNLESGMKNAYTMLGCLIGIGIVYPAEKRLVNFDTHACWWCQILKVIGGFALVLLVKEGFRSPLEAVFGDHLVARGVRYMLIVVVAGLVWPMTFRKIAKLGEKK